MNKKRQRRMNYLMNIILCLVALDFAYRMYLPAVEELSAEL